MALRVLWFNFKVRLFLDHTLYPWIANAGMLGHSPPAVLSSCCSFRLPCVSIDGTRPGSSAFPLLWTSQKMHRFVERLKRSIVFSRCYPTFARKMEKSSGYRWTVLWIINRLSLFKKKASNFEKKLRKQNCTPNTSFDILFILLPILGRQRILFCKNNFINSINDTCFLFLITFDKVASCKM